MCGDVFLISVDCLRPDYLGVYNAMRRQSPTIDRLAGGAAVFTQAVSHAPFTPPALSSLLTGAYPFQTGVRLLLGQLCDESVPTIAEYARRAGYVAGGFPSVFILNANTGLDRGFDCYRSIDDGIMTGRGGCWQTGRELNEAVDRFLSDAGSQRVFCWIHYFDLHDYHLDRSVPIETSYPRDLARSIDRDCIGGLVEILRRHGRFDESTLILTADHGEDLDPRRERGHGQHLYDCVLRVPLIIRAGELTKDGPRIGQQVRHVDLLPTLLDLWQTPAADRPTDLPGRSLMPLLEGVSHEAPISYAETSPRQLYEGDIQVIRQFAGPEQQSLRTGQHKLIRHEDGRRELYDLIHDPFEKHDVSQADAERADELGRELERLTEGAATRIGVTSYAEDERELVVQRLRDLGYVS